MNYFSHFLVKPNTVQLRDYQTTISEKGVSVMTCMGVDAEAVRVCLDIEAIARKYDMGFMDVMNMIMQVHCTWEGRENDS